MTPTKLGVLLPTREAIMEGRCDPRPVIDMAERIEALGFDSVWVGDSVFARPRFEALTLLSAVAARTSRVSVGTAVLVANLRHPVLLAHQLATLDQIAQGRLILGFGSGFDYPGTRREFNALGIPFDARGRRLESTVKSLRTLWRSTAKDPTDRDAGQRTANDIDLSQIEILPKPFTESGPPIWLAGAGASAIKRAGRIGDGWFPMTPTSELYGQQLRLMRDAATAWGRQPSTIEPTFYATISVSRKTATAEEALKAFMEQYYGAPLDFLRSFQACFAGTPDECIEWLNQYREAGAKHIVLRFARFDQEEQLQLASENLLPALR